MGFAEDLQRKVNKIMIFVSLDAKGVGDRGWLQITCFEKEMQHNNLKPVSFGFEHLYNNHTYQSIWLVIYLIKWQWHNQI